MLGRANGQVNERRGVNEAAYRRADNSARHSRVRLQRAFICHVTFC